MSTFWNEIATGYASHEIGLLIGVAFIAGLARGFAGFGAALIFVPVASSVIGPVLAAPILLLIDTSMALGLLPDAWRRADKRDVGFMALGALLGVPLGTTVLAVADPLLVRWALLAVVAGLLVLLTSGWHYRGQPRKLLTVGVGGIAGLFSGAAQIGGPPVVAYWLGGALQSVNIRANIVIYFAVSSSLSIASYVVGGLMTRPVFLLAVATGPAYGLGIFLGARLFRKSNEILFRRICYSLIGLAALVSMPPLDHVLR